MSRRWLPMGVLVGLVVTGCKPSDVLSVPAPSTTVGFTDVHDLRTAESIYNGGKIALFQALGRADGDPYLIKLVSTMSDEFIWGDVGRHSNIDARYTSQTELPQFPEWGDAVIRDLLAARSSLLLPIDPLQRLEPASGRWKVGEAYALVGYAELFMAEDYCAGVPLSQPLGSGGFVYGTPLTTDSLLATAEAHFASALANAHGNDTITALASVGLGRARLDRGHVADAATAVASVPTGFVYSSELAPDYTNNAGPINLYEQFLPSDSYGGGCPDWTVADREGGNGLDFVSARDPRLVFDSTIVNNGQLLRTCDWFNGFAVSGTWYYPVKFGEPIATRIPMATGVEARLIAAEAALKAGDAGTWATALNGLRAAAPSTYLQMATGVPALTADSTTTASDAERVDVMFRERAFWLFGTGTRLGDMRRLIRQYGRTQSTVFPTGPYPNGHNSNLPVPLASYGTDVDLTLPTPPSHTSVTNPNYKGCIAPTSAA